MVCDRDRWGRGAFVVVSACHGAGELEERPDEHHELTTDGSHDVVRLAAAAGLSTGEHERPTAALVETRAEASTAAGASKAGRGVKGTDCTPEQIAHARQFIKDRGWGESEVGKISLADFARLVAWYGAMRFKAGRDQTGGSFEIPGPIDVVKAAT